MYRVCVGEGVCLGYEESTCRKARVKGIRSYIRSCEVFGHLTFWVIFLQVSAAHICKVSLNCTICEWFPVTGAMQLLQEAVVTAGRAHLPGSLGRGRGAPEAPEGEQAQRCLQERVQQGV